MSASNEQRMRFFAIMDRGSTIRGAAIEVGVTPDIGYRWVKKAGLAAQRATPRVYTDADKAEFFRLLAEQGNVSAVARQLGFVRVTCYKWAHQAGVFTGVNVDARRDEFLKLRADGLTRAEAAERAGADKRSAHAWDRGIRQFYGGRVYKRDQPGYWEGGLIVGTLHRSAIATAVDRTSRFLLMVHLDANHNADTVSNGLIATMSPLPVALRRTLTWDQGAKLAEHRAIANKTGLDVYFCDAGSPWQRGTNENSNGLIRQYFPKATGLAAHSQDDLDAVANELNNRPRKSLDWDTPAKRLHARMAR